MTEEVARRIEAVEGQELELLRLAKARALAKFQAEPSKAAREALDATNAVLESYSARQPAAGEAGPASFANALALEKWLKGQGYKVGKSKIYADVKAGKLRPDPDGSFPLVAARAYAATLKLADGGGEGDRLAKKQERLLDLKVEAQEIENAEKRRRHELALGLLVPRGEVNKLLAAAVGVLKADMKQFFYARAREILFTAGGRPEQESELIEFLLSLQNEWFNRFAAECIFTARLGAIPPEDEALREEEDAGDLA